jgi:hypothetical protein
VLPALPSTLALRVLLRALLFAALAGSMRWVGMMLKRWLQ